MVKVCKKHARYNVLRKPRANCISCWELWLCQIAVQDDLISNIIKQRINKLEQ